MDFQKLHKGMDRALSTGKDNDTAFSLYLGVDYCTRLPVWAFANRLLIETPQGVAVARQQAQQDHIVPTARIINPCSTHVKELSFSYGEVLHQGADVSSVSSLMTFYRGAIQNIVRKNTDYFIYKENEATMVLLSHKQDKVFPYKHHDLL